MTETGEVRLSDSKSSRSGEAEFQRWVSKAGEVRRSAELVLAEKEKALAPNSDNSSAETLKSGTGHFGPDEEVTAVQ